MNPLNVCCTCGLNVFTGPTRFARTTRGSPTPEGPSEAASFALATFANTSIGKPVLHVTMGNKLQPCVSFFGADFQACSNGKSHPPLKVIRLRTSVSPDARNRTG